MANIRSTTPDEIRTIARSLNDDFTRETLMEIADILDGVSMEYTEDVPDEDY